MLRAHRIERGFSQERLALEAGVQRNYVSLLERGTNAVSIKILFKLAGVLGVAPSQLLAEVEVLQKGKNRKVSKR